MVPDLMKCAAEAVLAGSAPPEYRQRVLEGLLDAMLRALGSEDELELIMTIAQAIKMVVENACKVRARAGAGIERHPAAVRTRRRITGAHPHAL